LPGQSTIFTGLGQNLSPVVNQIHEKPDHLSVLHDGFGHLSDA
jgi:hypothetical protein